MQIRKIVLVSFCFLFLALSLSHAGAQSTPQRKFKHGGKIVTEYDRASNLTTVLLQSYPLKNSAGGPTDPVDAIDLIAGFTYQGNDSIGDPEAVEFVLEIARSRPRGKKEGINELTAEIENQQISLGKPRLLGSANENLSGDIQGLGTVRINSLIEKIGVLIPVDVFKRLAAAEQVKLETGDVKVTLRNKQLEALRDLASRIK